MHSSRVAVLADIHGNLPALEAVLAEVEAAGIDLVVLNGDLADGPFPAETLERLEALGDRAIWLRGNGDRWLAEAHRGRFRHADPDTEALLQWAARRISDAQADRLAGLPLTCTLTIEGVGTVDVCHATARSDNEMILVDGSVAHVASAFSGLNGDTLVLGHSHMPFDRLFDRRRVVNAGSVGMPYGHTGASWLRLGSDIVLKRTPYDVVRAAERILASGMPGAAGLAETTVLRTASDVEALRDLHAVMERQQRAGVFD